jgi:hypothetical protein
MEKRVCGIYGFDIEGERRREAGFLEEIRRRSTIAALSYIALAKRFGLQGAHPGRTSSTLKYCNYE